MDVKEFGVMFMGKSRELCDMEVHIICISMKQSWK